MSTSVALTTAESGGYNTQNQSYIASANMNRSTGVPVNNNNTCSLQPLAPVCAVSSKCPPLIQSGTIELPDDLSSVNQQQQNLASSFLNSGFISQHELAQSGHMTSSGYVDQAMVNSNITQSLKNSLLASGIMTEGNPIIQQRVIGEIHRPQHVYRDIELPQIVYEEKVVEVPQRVVVEQIKNVPVEEIRERIQEVRVPVYQEKIVEIPEYYYEEKIVEQVINQVQERVKYVPKIIEEEREIRVPKTEYREKIVEVPETQYREVPVEKIVEIPDYKIEYVYKDVPVPVQVPRHVPVERVVEVPEIQIQYKDVQVPVNQYREVPVEVEVPVPEYRDVPVDVFIDRPYEVIEEVYVPQEVVIPRTVEQPFEIEVPIVQPRFIEQLIPVPVPVFRDTPVASLTARLVNRTLGHNAICGKIVGETAWAKQTLDSVVSPEIFLKQQLPPNIQNDFMLLAQQRVSEFNAEASRKSEVILEREEAMALLAAVGQDVAFIQDQQAMANSIQKNISTQTRMFNSQNNNFSQVANASQYQRTMIPNSGQLSQLPPINASNLEAHQRAGNYSFANNPYSNDSLQNPGLIKTEIGTASYIRPAEARNSLTAATRTSASYHSAPRVSTSMTRPPVASVNGVYEQRPSLQPNTDQSLRDAQNANKSNFFATNQQLAA